MLAAWWIGILSLPTTALSLQTLPFLSPQNVESNRRAFEVLQILKRDTDNCPSGYNSCSKLGNADVCCITGTTCTADAANNIACCPTGASCTGSLTGASTATRTDTTTTDSSFLFPQGASATTTSSGVTKTESTLTGPYAFVNVPTSFVNAASCTSYYSLCQSEYTACTAALYGRYGVTVGGSGGGVTVEAVTALSQATSICSSLSAAACHGLSPNYCASVSSATAGFSGNGVPLRSSSLHDLVLGLAVGIAGIFV
ncbi:hypothetical protein N7495_003843 [Penicillium taxi]|uniref:uncharacterized protein n=1 Tax=Penicillium taxi TaxID=168475 RepID=UPI00254534C9|nr:uncharacterized protein N7495_003843 [Penicillium taxi]KAJ5899099.1 hypothetical protein N7495_003843 [Penicillium taxi]